METPMKSMYVITLILLLYLEDQLCVYKYQIPGSVLC